MSKDPTFPFYSQDFLVGTFGMEDASVGKYIRLLALQHQTGHISQKTFLKICGGKIDPEVQAKFITDQEGYFYNERLDEVLTTRDKFKTKQRENINQRWEKSDTKDIPEEYQSDTKAIPLESEKEIEKEIKKGEEEKTLKVPFEKFWELYDKKIDRKKCEPKWARLTRGQQEECIEKLPAYLDATPDKKYRRNPETYLNNRSWENEIIRPSPQGIKRPISIATLYLKNLDNGKF